MHDSDQRVIVTGAGSGMGEATARRFADVGASVLVVDLEETAAESTADAIGADGGDAVTHVADVSDPEAVEGMIDRAVTEFGGLDVLHNNAGIPQESTPVEDVDEETWDAIQDVNLKSAFLGTKYAVPHLRESDAGVILNTASTAAIRPRTGLSAYVASKAGMVGLTKQLAYELADDGIRVNAICPVATDTPMLQDFAAGDLSVESMHDTIPLGRLCEPTDVAAAAVFLASEDAAMITGTALEVDGGRDI
ncbi:SDR family NAD(P)-dependent oxidoreductase [Natronosalvus vescus]|uniref:SDR family NAD(P)-dependent oxidoreductase n=1 Tax=Natronosalvus vescus TaxID=2953881 RepID=UPI002090E327|nr:SDR family oxidoreductase [Natronosalvus vescus]